MGALHAADQLAVRAHVIFGAQVARRIETPDEDSAVAGKYIQSMLEELDWALVAVRSLAAILFVWMVWKLVWDKRKGQAAGGQQAGQTIMAMVGLVLFVVPMFIAALADFVMGVAVGMGDWFIGQF